LIDNKVADHSALLVAGLGLVGADELPQSWQLDVLGYDPGPRPGVKRVLVLLGVVGHHDTVQPVHGLSVVTEVIEVLRGLGDPPMIADLAFLKVDFFLDIKIGLLDVLGFGVEDENLLTYIWFEGRVVVEGDRQDLDSVFRDFILLEILALAREGHPWVLVEGD
jgi:hypothetical protein